MEQKPTQQGLGRYILPNVLAMIGMSCYILADTFFISMAAGTNGIAALNLALPVYGIIFAVGSMIGVGSAIRYSLIKPVDRPQADLYFSSAILWELICSLPFVALGIFAPGAVLRLLGADEVLFGVGLPYLRVVLCCTPMFMLNYTFTAFVRNDGAPNIAMAATLTSGLFNIAFDYLLMFPLKMGMVGAALATGLSPVVSMSVCMVHYLSKKNTVVFLRRAPSPRRLAAACSLGIAAFVGEISSGITTMVFNFLLLDLASNVGVAAYAVAANMALVGMALFNGVSQGLQPLASAVHGAGDRQAEERIRRQSILISLVIAVVLVGGVLLFADQLVAIFNSEHSAELAAYAGSGMRLYFWGFLLAAVNVVKAGFLSATGRGTEASVIALSRGVVAIVVFAFLLSRLLGLAGVWLAFPAAEGFTLLLSFWLERRGAK